MVSSKDPSPSKWSKHSLQWHPHGAALANAHSFVSWGGRQGVAPATALHIAGTWRGNPPLMMSLGWQRHCPRCPCHCHCNCLCRLHHHHHCCHHCRRRQPLLPLLPSAIAVTVVVSHRRHRLHLCRGPIILPTVQGYFWRARQGQMQYAWGGQTIKAGFPKWQGKDSPRHCLNAGMLVLMQDWAFLVCKCSVLGIRFFHGMSMELPS